MPPTRRGRSGPSVVWLAAIIAVLFMTGSATAIARSTDLAGTERGAGDVTPPGPSGAPALPAGAPVRVRVPAIGVDAALDPLGVNGDGTLQVPPYDRAGWYAGGPKPGEVGRAVIAAHVDSLTGPAVFYKLKELRGGDSVIVEYDDGTTVAFAVDGAETYPKSEFPTERVYGPADVSALRLITCTGPFDRRTGSYQQNLVVSATARPGPPGDVTV